MPYPVVRSVHMATMVSLLWGALPLHADGVTLKTGVEYTNVRTFLQSGYVSIIHNDGKIITIPVSKLKRIKRQPVDWARGITEEEYERRMEDELNQALKKAIQEREERDLIFRENALWRSALFPGAGQFYKEEYSSGILFMTTFWGGVAATAIADRNFREAYHKEHYYREIHRFSNIGYLIPESGIPDQRILSKILLDQHTEKTARAGRSVMYMAAFTGLVYVMNLVDARFLGTVENLDSQELSLDGYGRRQSGFQFYVVDSSFNSGQKLRSDKEFGLSYQWRF